jgi:hypothetical protein
MIHETPMTTRQQQLASPDAQAIDRRDWVGRHKVRLTEADVRSPLSVGSGRFCFTADITGLQTFEEDYAAGTPLGTMADWAWHSFPEAREASLDDTMVDVATSGRMVSYPLDTAHPSGQVLRRSPHRFSVGQIGLVLKNSAGSSAQLADLTEIDQTLDLWTGTLTSRFVFDGSPVTVHTVCDPEWDRIAVQIQSPLLADVRLAVRVAFPYPSGTFGPGFNAWDRDDAHRTVVTGETPDSLVLQRVLDATEYSCAIATTGQKVSAAGAHRCMACALPGQTVLGLTVSFDEIGRRPEGCADVETVARRAAEYWANYWQTGGAIDLSESRDPRWHELERRIVLSRYLTAIQSRGHYPPQETGLTCNSWHGKFHLEMHWWHSVHFPLWGESDVLRNQLDWYCEHLGAMQETASRQGYAGARWGKMLGPDAIESPSKVGPLVIWQQPHPIYYAELLYRAAEDGDQLGFPVAQSRRDCGRPQSRARGASGLHEPPHDGFPQQKLLERYAELVYETAAFMASFVTWNEARACFELAPPLVSASERLQDHTKARNPTFELSYWHWALKTANHWRERQGLAANETWEHIADNLAPLPIGQGRYLELEQPLMGDGGHPTMVAAYGLLPQTPCVDGAVMEATLKYVLENWDFAGTWGWDFPMLAMTAARLGDGEAAVDALLLEVDKNQYLANGHNYQTKDLPLYLPGNGGLLTAVAMMAAGWEGAPERLAPGFPDNGQWTVRQEGMKRVFI